MTKKLIFLKELEFKYANPWHKALLPLRIFMLSDSLRSSSAVACKILYAD